jgi:hypothetical protein
MKRNLKALGLAIVAVFAMSAIVAQAAQAKFDTIKTFPTQEHMFLKSSADETEPNQVFTTVTGGFSVTCKRLSLMATVLDGSTEAEGEPSYTECSSPLGAAEVNSNGCTYKFTSETNANEHAVVHLVCPAGKEIEISTGGCKLFVPGGQTLTGIHYANVQTGTAEREMHLTMSVTSEMNISGHSGGGLACELGGVPATFTQATYKGKATVQAVEDSNGAEGAATGITVETLTSSEMAAIGATSYTIKTFPTQEHVFLKAEADSTEPNQVLTLATGGFSWTCTGLSLTATAADKAVEFEGEPYYTGCNSGLGTADVRSNGCTYKFASETNANEHAVAHLICPTGKESEIETGGCVVFVAGGQTPDRRPLQQRADKHRGEGNAPHSEHHMGNGHTWGFQQHPRMPARRRPRHLHRSHLQRQADSERR